MLPAQQRQSPESFETSNIVGQMTPHSMAEDQFDEAPIYRQIHADQQKSKKKGGKQDDAAALRQLLRSMLGPGFGMTQVDKEERPRSTGNERGEAQQKLMQALVAAAMAGSEKEDQMPQGYAMYEPRQGGY